MTLTSEATTPTTTNAMLCAFNQCEHPAALGRALCDSCLEQLPYFLHREITRYRADATNILEREWFKDAVCDATNYLAQPVETRAAYTEQCAQKADRWAIDELQAAGKLTMRQVIEIYRRALAERKAKSEF